MVPDPGRKRTRRPGDQVFCREDQDKTAPASVSAQPQMLRIVAQARVIALDETPFTARRQGFS
jgi:hypothetical protein